MYSDLLQTARPLERFFQLFCRLSQISLFLKVSGIFRDETGRFHVSVPVFTRGERPCGKNASFSKTRKMRGFLAPSPEMQGFAKQRKSGSGNVARKKIQFVMILYFNALDTL